MNLVFQGPNLVGRQRRIGFDFVFVVDGIEYRRRNFCCPGVIDALRLRAISSRTTCSGRATARTCRTTTAAARTAGARGCTSRWGFVIPRISTRGQKGQRKGDRRNHCQVSSCTHVVSLIARGILKDCRYKCAVLRKRFGDELILHCHTERECGSRLNLAHHIGFIVGNVRTLGKAYRGKQ
jgi:hypothetical protein